MIPVAPGLRVHCAEDDYLHPWQRPVPVLMVHGISRNASIWSRWIPTVSARRRAYRLDLPGCGQSDVPPPDYRVTLDLVHGDLLKVLDHFGAERGHVVGGVLVRPVPVRVRLCASRAFRERHHVRHETTHAAACLRHVQTRHGEPGRRHPQVRHRRVVRSHLVEPHRPQPASAEIARWLADMLVKTPAHVAAAMIENASSPSTTTRCWNACPCRCCS
jgi:hypothetical protein